MSDEYPEGGVADLTMARQLHNAAKAYDEVRRERDEAYERIHDCTKQVRDARDALQAIDELVGPTYEFVNGERVEVDTPLVERVRWLKHAAGAEGDETSRVRGQLLRCQAALKDALETIINLSVEV
jgi:hypothetical protein